MSALYKDLKNILDSVFKLTSTPIGEPVELEKFLCAALITIKITLATIHINFY